MATDILSRIVATKKEEVAQARRDLPESEIRRQAEARPAGRGFAGCMARPGEDRIAVIAEIKRASPSKGDIRVDLDPAVYAAAYTRGGAAALSVLTDRQYFKGSAEDLIRARGATTLPILRKDFTISPYQIYEAKVLGADAILLIVRILELEELRHLLAVSRAVGLDALVEVHTSEDLEDAQAVDATLIGINNRNLKSFDTDIRTAQTMAAALTPGRIPVAASGIATREDIDATLAAGINSFLIGESLVRAADPITFLKGMIKPHAA